MTWIKITCEESDALIRPDRGLTIGSGKTDLDGEYGRPEVYREWVRQSDGYPVLRDYRWPGHPRGCEHFRFEA